MPTPLTPVASGGSRTITAADGLKLTLSRLWKRNKRVFRCFVEKYRGAKA